MRWTIYYANWDIIHGETKSDWLAYSDQTVQVVIGHEPPTDDDRNGAGFIGCPNLRVWTGDPEYDPFGFGPKYGSTVEDRLYWEILHEAAYQDSEYECRPWLQ